MGKGKKGKTSGRNKRAYAWFWLVFSCAVIIITVIIGLGCKFLRGENGIQILTSVTKDLITAIVITGGIGLIIKMVSEKFFTVKKNDRLLRNFGVLNVGTGVSTQKDIHNIFGCSLFNGYPQEIRMQFITGNVFLAVFKKEFENCLKHECNVKLLLVSTEQENLDFVTRIEACFGKENGEYRQQIEDVKSLVKEINAKGYKGKIRMRFYRDEYFYNFRSAKYCDEKTNTVLFKANINVQPFTVPATDCSIGLSGSYKSSDADLEKNIFYLNDRGFDELWEKYAHTQQE